MNLRDALMLIDELYTLPAQGEIVPWWEAIHQDHIGGVDTGWHQGSIFNDEGRLLFALLRAIRPSVVWEVGCALGCSSSHMLLALLQNDKGKLISADLYEDSGAQIPSELTDRHTIFRENAVDVFGQAGKSVLWPDGKRRKLPRPDFIFDDGGHETGQVAAVVELALQHLKPGGFLVMHDTQHRIIGEQIRHGLVAGGLTGMRHFLLEGTDTGVGVWQNDRQEPHKAPEPTEEEAADPPKRTTRKPKSVDG